MGIGDVIAGAEAQAEQQRMAELAPVFGMQNTLAQGNPFGNVRRGIQQESIQQAGNAATGQFNLNTQAENIRSGLAMNEGQNIQGFLGGLGQGLGGFLQGRQNRNFLNEMRQIQGGGTP